MSAAGSSVDGSGIRASGDSTWIKICGVRDPQVAKTAAEAGAVDDDGDVQKMYDLFHTDD